MRTIIAERNETFITFSKENFENRRAVPFFRCLVIHVNMFSLFNRCMMPLHYFPMDSQHCDLCLSQYKYPDSEQNIVWKNESDFDRQQLGSPKFNVDACLRRKYVRKNYTSLTKNMILNFCTEFDSEQVGNNQLKA